MSAADAAALLSSEDFSKLKNVKITGLMGMATFTIDEAQVKKEFNFLKSTFDKLKQINTPLKIVSMGMSGDYELAITCGSTMIRVGSSIFGERNY